MKKAVLKKVAGLQLYYKETPTQVFSPEYCEIFLKNTYFEEHLLTVASDFFKTSTGQWWVATSVLTLFLSSDNLLTGYEQLSYLQFNRNLSI